MSELAAAVLASFAAAVVNAIAGGGGLVSIPILFGVFPQAPPATLFGTNKSAMVWGTLWASVSYARHVRLPWATLLPAVAAALTGGCLGAWLVSQVSGAWLRQALPVMLAVVLVATLWEQELGKHHAPRHGAGAEAAWATLIAAALGVYDGFFGPGTGSFFIFAFVRVLGFDFLHAVASAKVLNTATNLASLVVFAWSGHVWWQFMIPMAVANVLGSMVGTRLALRHGSGFIRLVFASVVGVLILKTGYDAYLR
jgi:uncharacterized membrane protein YfcA